MTTLLYVLVYAIGGWLVAKGFWTVFWYRYRVLRCTSETTGYIIDTVEKRGLLSWPASIRYYPIFKYDTSSGTQIRASSYWANTKNQVKTDCRWTLLYDPARPKVFYAPEWDKGCQPLGWTQLVFGLIVLGVTIVMATNGQ